MHVWSSQAVVCEPRRPGLVGPPGFHKTNQRAQTCIFRGPRAFKNTTKIPREGRSRRREEKNGILRSKGEGKKRANFWAVQGKGGPNQTLKPTPTHEMKQHPRHSDNTQHNTTQHTTQQIKLDLAEVGLAKVGFGQSRFWPKSVWPKSVLAKVGFGQSRFGQSRFWPKSAIPLKH